MIHLNHKRLKGFTIVELLIVIVVIGILATIVIIAFNGVQTRATNTSRIAEIRSYERIFESYRALQNGVLPDVPQGNYCLGTGFPTGQTLTTQKVCRDWKSGDAAVTATESGSAVLMTELNKAGVVNNNDHNNTSEDTIGPFVINRSNMFELVVVLKSTTADICSKNNLTWSWGPGGTNNSQVTCIIQLYK